MRKILLFILFLPFVCAENISVEYPYEVLINQEFSVKISTDFNYDSCDFKIDIFDKDKRVSRIFNEGWKSTIYYITGLGCEEEAFKLKIENGTGPFNMTVKIRNEKTVKTFSSYLMVLADEVSDEEIEDEEKEVQIKNTDFENLEYEREEIVNEIILLNPKTIKTKENSSFLDTNYEYSLIGFLGLVIVLYLIKRKKKENEFG